VADALKDFVWSSFPFLAKEGAKVDYEWTGIMAFTPDENPLVGKIRGENEWISAGFTGYGMPRTFHGGKYLAEMMLGKLPSNKVIKQYDPARFNQQKAKL
jgi:glycine/D-amino acid oxidase-like deaminating enzyme